MKKIRIGVIGIGVFGINHAHHLYGGKVKDAVLGAVCDTSPERLEYAQKNFPEVPRYDNAQALMTSGDVDAIIIATPHYDHPPLTMAGFDNGLHVLCEKPQAVYTKAAREMNEKYNQKLEEFPGLVFGIMYNQRTNPAYRKMREIIQSGELGNVRRSNWIITTWYRPQAYYDSGDWRATWSGEGGGVLINQCPHNLDLWQWIVGMPTKITAHCHEGKWHDIEVEDDVTAYVEYADGSSGVFITSTGDVPGSNRFEITGDNGKLICEDNKITFYKLKVSEPEWTKTNDKSFGSPEYDVLEIEHEGTWPDHPAVIEAFGAKILGKGDLIADGREGINGLSISNAMHLSSWTGKTVSLPVDENAYHGELMKRVKTSRRKETGVSILAE